jgi:hypothetical protein
MRVRAQVRTLLNSNRRRKEADREGEQHEATECIDGYVQRTGHWGNNSIGIRGSGVTPSGAAAWRSGIARKLGGKRR